MIIKWNLDGSDGRERRACEELFAQHRREARIVAFAADAVGLAAARRPVCKDAAIDAVQGALQCVCADVPPQRFVGGVRDGGVAIVGVAIAGVAFVVMFIFAFKR